MDNQVEYQNHYEQEMYENVATKGQQPQYSDVENHQINYLALNQDPDECQQIYENTEIGTPSPRYVSVHANKAEQEPTQPKNDVSDKNPDTCKNIKDDIETMRRNTEVSEKPLLLPATPKKNKHCSKIIITVLVVMIFVMFIVGFVMAWFTKGSGMYETGCHGMNETACCGMNETGCSGMNETGGCGMKETGSKLYFTSLDKNMTTCSQKETILVLEIKSHNISEGDRTKLHNMLELGMSLKVAYLKALNKTDTWTYADALSYYPTENGHLCVQLYQSITNNDILSFNSSIIIEWTIICSTGYVESVAHAVGSGQIISSQTYKSPLKWFVTDRNTVVLYNNTKNKVKPNSSIKQEIGHYIEQGYDLTNAYVSNFNKKYFQGYFYSNILHYTRNDVSIAQYVELEVGLTVDIFKFNSFTRLMQLSINDDIDMLRYKVETPFSEILQPKPYGKHSKWSCNNCWKKVHETLNSKSENKSKLHQLLSAVRNGHKIRVSVQDSQNNSFSFEPHLLITRNNHLYGLHLWKAKVNSTNRIKLDKSAFWEWSIVSTKGKYIIQHCEIGNNTCQNSQRMNISSLKWAIDTYKWEPVFQTYFPRTSPSRGNIDTLIHQAAVGKPVRYMVHDAISNTSYFHQTHHINIHGDTEIVLGHMNEVLLQWDSNQEIQFASDPTFISRQLSSTGNMLQHMWLYDGTNVTTAKRYNYLEGDQYSITWFIANKKY